MKLLISTVHDYTWNYIAEIRFSTTATKAVANNWPWYMAAFWFQLALFRRPVDSVYFVMVSMMLVLAGPCGAGDQWRWEWKYHWTIYFNVIINYNQIIKKTDYKIGLLLHKHVHHVRSTHIEADTRHVFATFLPRCWRVWPELVAPDAELLGRLKFGYVVMVGSVMMSGNGIMIFLVPVLILPSWDLRVLRQHVFASNMAGL